MGYIGRQGKVQNYFSMYPFNLTFTFDLILGLFLASYGPNGIFWESGISSRTDF